MTHTASLLDELDRSLESGTDEQCVQALWRITDLFITGATRYTDEQVGLFDDVIARLMTAIESKARAKLASRLAPIPNAPIKVIRALAFDDDIDVARPVLIESPRLDDPDLIANANAKSQQHMFAITQRPLLSEGVTDVIVNRGDPQVVRSIVKNTGARFSDAGFRMLVKRSIGDDILATQVGRRPDIPRQHFLALLDKASAAVREKLASANPGAINAVDGVLGEIVGSIRSEARNASPNYAAAKAQVETLYRNGQLGEPEVHAFARERKFESTAVALSLLCQVPIDVVERALLDAGPEILLILAKVAGLSSTTAKAILLLRAAERGMSAQDLEQALSTFSRLQPETARRVLRFYNDRQKRMAESVAQ
ncbi:MAG: DUF2336 domain-containing protein [Xanthobacteraceae bacterium]